MKEFKGKIHFAWWVLVGLCVVVGLSKSALSNSQGLFLPSITKDLGINTGNLTLYLSITSIVLLIFLPIGGKLVAKYDVRYLITAAVILQAGGFGLFGLGSSVWWWYIIAIPSAIGNALTTIIVGPVLVNRWFKKRNGLALGILGASGGLFGAIAMPAIGNIIFNLGWRNAYFTVSFLCLVILIPTVIFLLRRSPKDKGITPYGQMINQNDDEKQNDLTNSGITHYAARKSLAFLMLIIFFFIITAIASFSTHIPNYLENEGFSSAVVGNIMSAQMIGLLIGSLSLGYFCDLIGSKKTSLLEMITGIVPMILLLFFTSNTVIVVIAVFFFGFLQASVGTLAPALTTVLFGRKDYDQIYSNASTGLAVSAIVALPTYGYIFDITGSYKAVLLIIIAMLIVNVFCLMAAFHSKKKMVQKGLWQ